MHPSIKASIDHSGCAVWLRHNAVIGAVSRQKQLVLDEIREAENRYARFAPVLSQIFSGEGWDGRIRSELLPFFIEVLPGRR